MASIILLIVVFAAVANAGYVWIDEENDAPPGYKRMYVPPLVQPPPLPGFENMPLPQPPPLYVRDFSQGFQNFPRPFPIISIPSPAEIKNIKPAPGQIFNGISVKSVSGIDKDEYGNPIRRDGTTFVVNKNGDVKETKVGKNPPNIEDPIILAICNKKPHRFQLPKIPEPVKFKPFHFKPFEPMTFKPFKPITFKPITFKPIDMNYEPGEGETYVAVSHSTHSESSNNNGVVSNSGGRNSMLNVNGKKDQEVVEFRNDPENDQAKENEAQDEE